MLTVNKTKNLIACICILCSVVCTAQKNSGKASISGNVIDATGQSIPGAHIKLNTKRATVSNELGQFLFQDLSAGVYTISTSVLGFEVLDKKINLNHGQKLSIMLVLKADAIELSEVAVTAKSTARTLKESVASVEVLEVKSLYAQSANTSDIVKQISGVNVRQAGGFGSNAEVYINGMSGKQVKFFLDGIPLSYFGSGLNLNVLPINLMNQIEVYKGVVPVHLGADALGGAINIVPRKAHQSYLDASYSIGSFNSHKINLNGQFVDPKLKFLVGINSFYNYADNNYKVDVEIPNAFGNPEPAKVKRFHDRFSNHLLNLYTGVFDQSYADELVISARYSGLKDDIQHNAIMAQPYGETSYEESTLGVSVEYGKRNIVPQVDVKWYGGFNATLGSFIDTTLNAYTWDGQVYRRRTDGGEISASGNLLELNTRNAVNRLNLNYEPWSTGKFTFNWFSSWFKRVGEDPFAAEFYGEDYYVNPTELIKNAIGLAYQHTMADALESYTAIKFFNYNADGYAIQNLEFRPNSQSVSNLGFSQSFRYYLTDQLLAKASYEYATRLPDELELFGDFTLVRPNPSLEPEKSHNANLSGQYHGERFQLDFNTFYRLTENIIWLRTSQFFAQYQNLLRAAIKGVDLEVRFQPLPGLRLKANATFQDIRNRSPRHITGSVDDRYFDARLPNIPYLFGNSEIRYQKENFLGTESRFAVWWSANYVHKYFLFWAVDGNRDLKNSIPSQFLQNVGLSYVLPDNRFSITLESHNIFDQKAYDNFNVQRPGRAFHITLRTYIK